MRYVKNVTYVMEGDIDVWREHVSLCKYDLEALYLITAIHSHKTIQLELAWHILPIHILVAIQKLYQIDIICI